jgi:hypothetical protein
MVAVAASGTDRVMKSYDAVTWTTYSCPARVWVSVEYDPVLNLFAAVSFDGYVMTSTNGETWTEIVPSITGRQWSDITTAPGGMFLAVASGPQQIPPSYDRDKVMTSTNGVDWIVGVDIPAGRYVLGNEAYGVGWREVMFTCNRFVAVAQATYTSTNAGVQPFAAQVMSSADGLDWYPKPTDSAVWGYQIGTGIAWNGSRIVTVGINTGTPQDDQAPLVMTSDDLGETWVPRVPGINTHWRSIAWGPVNGGTFVAVGDTTNIYSNTTVVMTSPNGITWTPQTAAAIKNWQNVHWFSGLQLPG